MHKLITFSLGENCLHPKYNELGEPVWTSYNDTVCTTKICKKGTEEKDYFQCNSGLKCCWVAPYLKKNSQIVCD